MLVGVVIMTPLALATGRPDGPRRGVRRRGPRRAAWARSSGLVAVYAGLRVGQIGIVAPIAATEGAIAALDRDRLRRGGRARGGAAAGRDRGRRRPGQRGTGARRRPRRRGGRVVGRRGGGLLRREPLLDRPGRRRARGRVDAVRRAAGGAARAGAAARGAAPDAAGARGRAVRRRRRRAGARRRRRASSGAPGTASRWPPSSPRSTLRCWSRSATWPWASASAAGRRSASASCSVGVALLAAVQA